MDRVPRIPARLAIAFVLAAATIGVFLPVLGHGFVDYDDDVYVYRNPHVVRGFDGGGVAWAFTSTDALNWHPVTWLSLELDSEVHGLSTDAPPYAKSARGFHATSLLLHAANTALLFLLLARLTGANGRSAFVATLFGLHPLHVESVAWVAERKDVLCAFFGILAIFAYAAWAESRSKAHYALAALLLAAGLGSKPMLVTLPLLFLALDLWPLRRSAEGWSRLVREKVPLFALAAASAAITFLVQSRGGAVRTIESIGLGARLSNAAVATVAYLMKTIAPAKLAVFYPHPGAGLDTGKVALACVAIALATALAIRCARTRPYVTFGWAWYLVSLLPVIGIVQVGAQAMADRYTYLPLIGPFVAIAWGVSDAVSAALGARTAKALLAAVSVGVLVVLGFLARAQIGVWKDSETLFRHALACTKDNWIAHNDLGLALLEARRTDEAMTELEAALRIRPEYFDARVNLGRALLQKGRNDDARTVLQEAVRANPASAEAQTNLGIALALDGELEEGIGHLRKAVELEPERVEWQMNLDHAESMRRAGK
jgi:tetratricopeptide (TPR) repeat protein